MEVYTASKARAKLYTLIDDVAEAHEPVYITSKRHKAVMISEEDFRAIQETLYLLSVPGMRETILKGRKASTDECSDHLDW